MRAISLLYHDVVPVGREEVSGFQGADADVYKMDCERFTRHLHTMRTALKGVQPSTAMELLSRWPAGPTFLLTFDDGGVSAHLYVADWLDEFGWKAHFYITGNRVGTAGFVDGNQIRELRRRGHIIGSHSFSHPTRMARCSIVQLEDEWRRSIQLLQDILGETVETASVPGGYYSRQVALAAGQAGIKLLFNSEPVTRVRRVETCLVLGRFTARSFTPHQWPADIISGELVQRATAYFAWNSKKILKSLGGTWWLRARLKLLNRSAQSSARRSIDLRD